MKKLIQLFLVCLCIFVLPYTYAANAGISPVGYWKTIDDVSGKPKSILRIYESNHVLYGQVVKIFPRPGYNQNEVCSACKGSKHDQPIVGMTVMEGLTQSSSNSAEWSGGEILDPLTGNTYRCTVTVSKNGESLNARGYLGISLFGRSQTWVRVANEK